MLKVLVDILKDIRVLAVVLSVLLAGCANHGPGEQVAKVDNNVDTVKSGPAADDYLLKGQNHQDDLSGSRFKPSVKWRPSYKMSPVSVSITDGKSSVMRVGANIKTKNGRVPLNTVINGMAKLKGMNVSWSSDVDQDVMVNVNIQAKDEFWNALKNTLRQADYFYEFKENTIIVRYKDTKRFYISNPFLVGSYQTSVGGDFLGANEVSSSLHGNLQVDHNAGEFDLWASVEENLQKILERSSLQALDTSADDNNSDAGQTEPGSENSPAAGENSSSQNAPATGQERGFYYTIDKPLGIINVTAPRSIMKRVEVYMDALNKELSRQVVIDAKLLEVQLTDDSRKGIDWSSLLRDSKFNFEMAFGAATGAAGVGQIYPTDGVKFLRSTNMGNKSVELVVNFLDDFGDVKVLSNPKLSLLNGQPGLITGGKTQRIVDKVTSTISTGTTTTVTYDIETRDILSGIGMSVVANIDADDEIILHLTPVSTELLNPDNIEEKQFGSEATGFVMVQLPRVSLRELTTMAKVKSGQLLIIGGLISEDSGVEGNSVPILGDIPYLGYAFKSERKFTIRKELVILLRPQIVQL